MRYFSGPGLVVLTLVAIQPWFISPTRAQERKNNPAANELVGRYQIVSGEKDGQPIPDERIKGSTMQIATNAMTTFDKDEKEVYVATYELDTSKRPWRIKMTSKVTRNKGEETKTSGLIEKTGDMVKLIYALPGGQAPTDFRSGEKQQMFLLKKMAD